MRFITASGLLRLDSLLEVQPGPTPVMIDRRRRHVAIDDSTIESSDFWITRYMSRHRPAPGCPRNYSSPNTSETDPTQNCSGSITSPPFRVISDQRTPGSIFDLMNRTDPSAIAALSPPGCSLPQAPRLEALENATSCGAVHGARSFVSTTRIVLAVPSVTSSRRTPAVPPVNSLATDDHLVRAHLRPALPPFVERAGECRRHLAEQGPVVRAKPGLVQAELTVECVLPHEGQDHNAPAQERPAPVVESRGGREASVAVVIAVHGQPDLLQVVSADRPSHLCGPSALRA